MKSSHRHEAVVLVLSAWIVAATTCTGREAHAGAPRPGDRVEGGQGSPATLRLPAGEIGPHVDFSGLYVYTTPDAPPRWLRIQQSGTVVWGTVDLNNSFGMCARERVDGNVSGNNVVFSASLATASCPCSGAGSSITFLGTRDVNGDLTGPWANTCNGQGNWTACYNSAALGEPRAATCGSLPDNDPPMPFSSVPGSSRIGVALGGLGLVVMSLVALRSVRRSGPNGQAS